MTSICLKETPIATYQSRKQRRGTDPWSVWAISRWHGVRWNRIKKQEHKTQVTETEPQISQSIEMTGDVGDLQKFPLCEFRFYEVLPPKTDILPLALEEPSLRNRKKGKGPLSAVNLKLVNMCLQMVERGFCVRKGFSLGAPLRPRILLFKSPNSCNIKLTVAQLVILSLRRGHGPKRKPLCGNVLQTGTAWQMKRCELRWIDVWLKWGARDFITV